MNESEEEGSGSVEDSRGSAEEEESLNSFSDSQASAMYNIIPEKFTGATINKKNYDKALLSLQEIIQSTTAVREDMNRIYLNAETQTRDEANRNNPLNLNEIPSLTEEETEEEKEIRRLKEEIEYIKLDHKKEIRMKNDQLISYEEQIKDYQSIISKIQVENSNLRQYQDKNELMKIQSEKKRNVNKIVLSTKKSIILIAAYLSNDEIFILAQSTKKLYNCLFHQAECHMVIKKLDQRKNIIEAMISPDTATKYDVSEKKIEELIEKYITNASLPGNELRNRITHSLVFIEKKIREPLREIYQINTDSNSNNNKNQLLKNTIISLVSAIKGDKDFKYEDSTNDLHNTYLILPKENFKNLDENDSELLKLCETNEQLNIKFEFTSHAQIKELLEYFIQANLQKATYAKFLSALIEQYSKLLYACHISLKEIKEMEIVNHAINSRFRKYKFLCEEMQVELNGLNKFAEDSKEIKNKLQMQKNELEIKYNINLTEISRLISEKGKAEKKIYQMSDEMIKNKTRYDELQEKLINDYKLIQNDYKKTKNEKDMFYGLLVNFQKFFMNYVTQDGEIN